MTRLVPQAPQRVSMLPTTYSGFDKQGDFRYTIDRNTRSVFVFADAVMSSMCATTAPRKVWHQLRCTRLKTLLTRLGAPQA